MRSRHPAHLDIARATLLLCALAGVLVSGDAKLVGAQVDTTRTPSGAAVTIPQAPLSPRRAFLFSFLAPGYSQSVFGRHKAAAGFLLFEAISVVMIRESAADVHEARRGRTDTLVVSWIDQAGTLLSAPDTVTPRFGDREVRSRQARVEDWIAVLVANHLFAGADAYVASHLWDVPARLSMRLHRDAVVLMASIEW